MRFSDWCAVNAGALFIVGLAPAIAAQAELASPGLSVFPRSAAALFQSLLALHGGIVAISVPLAFVALGFALAGERNRFWRSLAQLTLAACFGSALALTAGAFGARSGVRDVTDVAVFPVACGLLLTSVVVAASVAGARAVTIIFAAFSTLALLLAAFYNLILTRSGVDSMFRDSYAVVSAIHAAGLAIVLAALAIASAYVARSTGKPGIWFAIVFSVVIFVVGFISNAITEQLGFSGEPREIMDYPYAFAQSHHALTIYSAVLVGVTALAFGIIAFLRTAHRSRQTEADAFA